MFFRSRKPRLTREQALAAIPVRNPVVGVSRNDSGRVELHLERQRNWRTRLISILFYVPKHKTIELDERGSFVWNQIDDNRSVQQIVQSYRERYMPDQRAWKESELQVVEFLRMLARKRLVAMAIVERKDKKPAEKTPPAKQEERNQARATGSKV